MVTTHDFTVEECKKIMTGDLKLDDKKKKEIRERNASFKEIPIKSVNFIK